MPRARSSWASDPGSWMPASNSTTPSPAATAQALQWGTPGHGSGRRRRKTPGTTRSPRPSSRLRVASVTCAETTYTCRSRLHSKGDRQMVDQDSPTEDVARRYFEAIAARDVDAAVALWAPGGREIVRGQVDVTAPEGVRAFI